MITLLELADRVEALAYMIRAYEHESDAEDPLLMVPKGSSIFSVASARAALSSIDLPGILAALEGWQPMETAPRDGTVFIARNADHPNWGSWAMLRNVIWRYNSAVGDFFCEDKGGWLHVLNHEPDHQEGHTSGGITHVPFAMAPDDCNISVRYEWMPFPTPTTESHKEPSQ